MTALLSARGVHAGYGRRTVLCGVDLEIRAGERVLLAGPNGSGKSTLLRVVSGVIAQQSGEVEFKGRPLEGLPIEWRMRHGMGYLKQTRNVFLSLTVLENLELAGYHAGVPDATLLERAFEIFPFLESCGTRKAGLLSGGERQALAVAMVLMHDSELFLMDEPTAGLAPPAAADLLRAIDAAQKAEGHALVIVEHNLKSVIPWVSRAIFMDQGRIVADESEPSRFLEPGILEGYYFK